MINYRKLDKDDNKLFDNLISNEGKYYQDFLNMGWSNNQIINQGSDRLFGTVINDNSNNYEFRILTLQNN